jgi:HTH-type transcriptional regulator / antitoxin MqsA
MEKSPNTCPLCEEGHLEEKLGKNKVTYGGVTREIDMLYAHCSYCDSELGGGNHLRENKRIMTRFKKEVDGLLTGAEVRAIREALAISQVEATKIFGGGPVAFSKYEADDITQSEGMDKLLRVTRAVPEAYQYLKQLAGFDNKQKRTTLELLQRN